MFTFKPTSKLLTTPEHRTIFDEFANRYCNSKLLVLTHDRADWDTTSSAAVLSRLMGWRFSINLPAMRGVAEGISKLGFTFDVLSSLNLSDFEGVVLVDGNARGMFPKSISQCRILLAIDHHKPSDSLGARNEIIVPNSESNARIIYELLGLDALDRNMAAALALGIYADTVRFEFVRDSSAFVVFAELFEKSGLTMPEIQRYFSPYFSDSELELFKNAIHSVRILSINGIRIAITTGPIDLKVEIVDRLVLDHPIVIFGSQLPGKSKVSLRLNLLELRSDHSLSLDAAEIMQTVGNGFFGAGGGHFSAAGCTGEGTVGDMIDEVIKLIRESLPHP